MASCKTGTDIALPTWCPFAVFGVPAAFHAMSPFWNPWSLAISVGVSRRWSWGSTSTATIKSAAWETFWNWLTLWEKLTGKTQLSSAVLCKPVSSLGTSAGGQRPNKSGGHHTKLLASTHVNDRVWKHRIHACSSQDSKSCFQVAPCRFTSLLNINRPNQK